jgi:hypothetical protein
VPELMAQLRKTPFHSRPISAKKSAAVSSLVWNEKPVSNPLTVPLQLASAKWPVKAAGDVGSTAAHIEGVAGDLRRPKEPVGQDARVQVIDLRSRIGIKQVYSGKGECTLLEGFVFCDVLALHDPQVELDVVDLSVAALGLTGEDRKRREAREVGDRAGLDVQPHAGEPEKGRDGALGSRQEYVDEAQWRRSPASTTNWATRHGSFASSARLPPGASLQRSSQLKTITGRLSR